MLITVRRKGSSEDPLFLIGHSLRLRVRAVQGADVTMEGEAVCRVTL